MQLDEAEELAGPLWTVITVTFNSADDLRHLGGELRTSEGVEWIVVDNASSDDSAEVAQTMGARVIRLSTNLGFGAANNLGLREAGGRYVLFANPDLFWRTGDLETLAEHLASGSEHLLAPQLMNVDGTLQPNGRGIPTIWRKVGNRTRRAGSQYRIYPPPGGDVFVAWVMGAAVCGRKDTFARLGGWNEEFFLYYEDHELGLKAWRDGVPVVLTDRVRWTHGWARETASLRIKPWLRESQAARRFFSIHPGLLLSWKLLGSDYRPLYRLVGTPAKAVTRCRENEARAGEWPAGAGR